MLGSDVLLQVFRKIGQIRPGYTPSPEIMADGLTEWQNFFDSLNAERTAQFTNPDYVYPVAGPGSKTDGNGYEIGPTAADWIGPRPESIIRANLKFTSAGAYPVYIQLKPITQEEWASLAIRQMPGINVTAMFWYDPQFPNGVFNVFPPLNGNAIELFTSGVLVAPANLGLPYAAPAGYWDMIVFGLAERLYFMATKEVVVRAAPYAIIAAKAKEAMDRVKRINRPIQTLASDMRTDSRRAGNYDSFVTYTGTPY